MSDGLELMEVFVAIALPMIVLYLVTPGLGLHILVIWGGVVLLAGGLSHWAKRIRRA